MEQQLHPPIPSLKKVANPEDSEVVADVVARIYSCLAQFNSLQPTPRLNDCFKELVDICLTAGNDVEDTIQQMRQRAIEIEHLWSICAEGEAALEYFWAERNVDLTATLDDFPYYSNYNRLTDFELRAMREHRELRDQAMLYVGQGSLPLTPLMFTMKKPHLCISCLDKDTLAVKYACKIFSLLGVHGSFYCGDIGKRDISLREYDILFLSSLVGDTNEEKNLLLEQMRPDLRRGSLVVVRSVPDDHRRLLYPKFSLSYRNTRQYNVLSEYVPKRAMGIINSIQIIETR